MTGYDQQREQLEEEVARSEEDLRVAVAELKDAVSRPFRAVERLAENPMPWMLAGILFGVWLGVSRED